ncbi:MAG: hypothetical protein V1799_11495 [bacterium]
MSKLPQKSQFLIYQAEGGAIKIDVRFENETVWLTQQHMADLFQTTKQNIGQHLKNVFEEGELVQESVVKNFFTTAADGKNYSTNFYNLDATRQNISLHLQNIYAEGELQMEATHKEFLSVRREVTAMFSASSMNCPREARND